MDNFFEVVLRVPPLIVLDLLLATNFGTKKQSNYEFMKSQMNNFLFSNINKTTSKLINKDNELNLTDIVDLNDSDNDITYLSINLNLLGRL